MAAFDTITIDDATERLIDYRGKTPPKTDFGVRLLTAKVVKGGQILDEPKEYIAAEFYDEWMRRGLPQKLDVLLTTEAPLGEVAVLRNSERIALAQRIILLRARPGRVDPLFLFYALQSDFGQGELKARGTGTTVLGIKQSELRQVRIPFFPLPVQRGIAGILSAYDELIENSQRRIWILEQMARALHRELFVLSHSPGNGRGDCSVGILGDFCELVKDRFDEAADSKLPLLDLAHLPSHSLAPQESGNASDLMTARILFRRGDTLFGAIRSYLHKVVIAPYPGVTNVSVLVLRPKRSEFRSLLAVVASSPDTIRWTDQHSSGTKMPVINGSVFLTMPVSVPALGLAAHFENTVGPMLDELCMLSVRNQNLRRTRDLLLPRLLSGQIEVQGR